METQLYLDALAQSSQRAESLFGNLRIYPLNWKENQQKWSIGQCLEHLITTNETYFTHFEAIANGTYQPTFWQKISPLSAYFGNWVLETTRPVVTSPLKAPPTFAPTQSEVSANIVSNFITHNQALSTLIAKLANANPQTVLSSPALGLITYPLKDALQMICQHEERHLNQAEKVLTTFKASSDYIA